MTRQMRVTDKSITVTDGRWTAAYSTVLPPDRVFSTLLQRHAALHPIISVPSTTAADCC